jgi:hypothetical protein
VQVVQSIKVAGWAWRGAFSMMLRPVTWVPFLIVTAVQFIVLAILVFFDNPLILPLGLPLVQRLGGEAATHYPVFYYALPTLFSRSNLVIGALVASIAGGTATLLFARFWGLGNSDRAWRRAFRAAPKLIPLTLLVIAILYGVGALVRLVPRDLMLTNSAVRWGTRLGMLAVFVIVQSLLGYTTAWVVLMGHKFFPALRDSIKVTGITLLPTLLVVALPTAILFPISYATSRIDLIAQKLRPETTLALVSVQIVMELFCTFILAAALTRLFVWRMEASR